MMRLAIYKRKLKSLIERIKLSEAEYNLMKERSVMFNHAVDAIHMQRDIGYETITDQSGMIIKNFPKTMTTTIVIHPGKLLKGLGLNLWEEKTKIVVADD